MKAYRKHLSILPLLVVLLLAGVQETHGQAAPANNHNTTRSEKTVSAVADDDTNDETSAPAAQDYNSSRSNNGTVAGGPDNDCDGVCAEVRGTVQVERGSVLIVFEQEGRAPAHVRLVSEGAASAGSRAVSGDYNNSRSNNSRAADLDPTPIYMSINDGGIAAPASSANHNTTGSKKTRASSGTLEHTDDWIAARATASDSFFDITFVHVPTDVHSGKLTGVRMHSPFKVRATVAADGRFSVLLPPTPGTYRVVAQNGNGQTHRGHVTVLK